MLVPKQYNSYIYNADSFGLITQNESGHSESVSAPQFGTINTEFIMRRIDYQPNQIINGLTFLEEVKSDDYNRKASFRCHCGKEFVTTIQRVKTRATNSCGCSKGQRIGDAKRTHGLRQHRLYKIWTQMKTRCYNDNYAGSKYYSKRGITICDEWRDDFQAFYDWAMDNGYDDKLQIDRKDNDGNYEPSNCRFVTNAQNSRNSRNTKLTWGIINEIRNTKLLIPNITGVEIAKAYHISATHVCDILKGKVWEEASL